MADIDETGSTVPLVDPDSGRVVGISATVDSPWAGVPGGVAGNGLEVGTLGLGLGDINRIVDKARGIPGISSALSAADWLDARARAANDWVARYFAGLSTTERMKLTVSIVGAGCFVGGIASAGAIWTACAVAATGLGAVISSGQAAQKQDAPTGVGASAALVSHYCAIGNAAGVLSFYTRMVCAMATAAGVGSGAAKIGSSGSEGRRRGESERRGGRGHVREGEALAESRSVNRRGGAWIRLCRPGSAS